jgi:hypothetical protein
MPACLHQPRKQAPRAREERRRFVGTFFHRDQYQHFAQLDRHPMELWKKPFARFQPDARPASIRRRSGFSYASGEIGPRVADLARTARQKVRNMKEAPRLAPTSGAARARIAVHA